MTDMASNLRVCGNGHHTFGIRRALLVDNNNVTRMVHKAFLRRFGLYVAESENALAGVRRFLDGEQYDVVFIDRYMPVMDGVQATHLLRNMGITAKIVGISSEDDGEEFLQAGADAFQIMPINHARLAALLEALGLDN